MKALGYFVLWMGPVPREVFGHFGRFRRAADLLFSAILAVFGGAIGLSCERSWARVKLRTPPPPPLWVGNGWFSSAVQVPRPLKSEGGVRCLCLSASCVSSQAAPEAEAQEDRKASARAKDKKHKDAMVFPLMFNPKGPGLYPAKLVFASGYDVRVLEVEGRCRCVPPPAHVRVCARRCAPDPPVLCLRPYRCLWTSLFLMPLGALTARRRGRAMSCRVIGTALTSLKFE